MLLATIALFAVFCCVALAVWKYVDFLTNPLHEILGPKPEDPVYGSLRTIKREQSFEPILRWAREYGSIYSYVGPFLKYRIVLADVEAARYVLVTNVDNYSRSKITRRILLDIVGENSVLMTAGDYHRWQRRILFNAFGPTQMKRFIQVFVSKAQALSDRWLAAISASEEKMVAVTGSVHKMLTLDIIGLSAFDVDFMAVEDSEAGKSLRTAFTSLQSTGGRFEMLLVLIAHFLLFDGARRFILKDREAAVRVLRGKVLELIAERRASESLRQEDLLQVILETQDASKMSNEEIVDHCVTFLIAGHETTGNGLSWATLCLSEHPEVVEKLREELDAVDALDLESIKSCKYLEAVVKEILRLYPPVPILARVAEDDDKICGHLVPKGSLVMIPVAVAHRLEENFAGGDQFKPERWLDGQSTLNQKAFLPFSIGEFSCIGNRFAMFEMMVVMAVLYTQFDIRVVGDGYRRASTATMRPKPDLKLEVRARQRV